MGSFFFGEYLMTVNAYHIKSSYSESGYYLAKDYFSVKELCSLKKTVLAFFDAWKKDNYTFYCEEAFNASLITGSQYLPYEGRLALFDFIGSQKILALVDSLIPNKPAFMNTQLFFDPVNPSQKNFWHRDCQYDHDVQSQKRVITQTQVLHLRIPLFDEPGIELVPGSHKRWDTQEELDIRLEQNAKTSCENIIAGKKIPLAAGDVLLFSADMIHRGLYGLNRLAFDILVFDSAGDYVDYVDDDCLPSQSMIAAIKEPSLFVNTLILKKQLESNT